MDEWMHGWMDGWRNEWIKSELLRKLKSMKCFYHEYLPIYMYGIVFINTYLDTNECDAYFGVCSQYCKNTVGNYSCFCAPGFVESPSHGCKASGKNNQLLWSA